MKLPVKNLSIYAMVLILQGLIYNLTGRINTLPFQAERILELPLAIDSMIPFVPETIWLYCLYYVILMSGFLLAFDRDVFPRFLKNFVVMSAFADLMFVFVPVSMPLQVMPLISSGQKTHELLNLILAVDTRSNCFPSLHCAHSFLITYWFWNSNLFSSLMKRVLVLMTMSVVGATLFVKQHWFVDIVGAFLLFILLVRIYEKKLQNQRV